jgi:hypothetical protein
MEQMKFMVFLVSMNCSFIFFTSSAVSAQEIFLSNTILNSGKQIPKENMLKRSIKSQSKVLIIRFLPMENGWQWLQDSNVQELSRYFI